MENLQNVTFVPRANIYFDGKVTSRKVILQNGEEKTFGIMLPGEYEFSTGVKEHMDILNGKLSYQLTGEEWQTIDGTGDFYVPANDSFKLKVVEVTDYCCSYIAE